MRRLPGYWSGQFLAVDDCISWSYGVTVSTLDSESSDRGSNPRRTFFHSRASSSECCCRVKKHSGANEPTFVRFSLIALSEAAMFWICLKLWASGTFIIWFSVSVHICVSAMVSFFSFGCLEFSRAMFGCMIDVLDHGHDYSAALCFTRRDSSVGRASDRRSEGPRFDPGSRHLFCYVMFHACERINSYPFCKCIMDIHFGRLWPWIVNVWENAPREARTPDLEVNSLTL